MNLLGSHDTERVLTHCGGDVEATKLAFALLFTAEGAPMVYYGDEIGMTGFNDPDCRGALIWDETRWNHELLAWVRQLADLRQAHVALRRGSERTIQATENTIVRARVHPEEELLILANRARTGVHVAVAGFAGRLGTDLLTGEQVRCDDVAVPGMGVSIVKLE